MARVEKLWTQAELAERLTEVSGVKWTQFMITSFETARRVISFLRLWLWRMCWGLMRGFCWGRLLRWVLMAVRRGR